MARIFCADDIDRALERELTAREKMNSPAEIERLRIKYARLKGFKKREAQSRERAGEATKRKWGKGNASDFQDTTAYDASGSEAGSSRKSNRSK